MIKDRRQELGLARALDSGASAGAEQKLNVGCGLDIRPGWTNIDLVDYGGNQLVDLNRYPWPFQDSQFDYILCSHILEHLLNFNLTITEIYRVGKPGAVVEVRVPFFLSTKYYSEPDHRIPFGIRSFDNYEHLEGRRLRFYERWKLGHRTNYGSPARFIVHQRRFNYSNFRILKWMNLWINLEPVIFERFFAGVFPPEEVYFLLEILKTPK